MASIQRFSAHVIDYAERLSRMADAAEGQQPHSGPKMSRWVLLPASGAALYALVRSDVFSRRAKEVVDDAKARASDLPDDLIARVRPGTQASGANNGAQRRSQPTRQRTTARKKTSSRANSSRKPASASR
jgi:hypothetical protein